MGLTSNKTTEWFIEKAKEIHGDKYDYSKVVYTVNTNKVTIICPIHGEFQQLARGHIYEKNGCPKCRNGNRIKISNNDARVIKARDEFEAKSKKIHGEKYDYSKAKYINSYTKLTLICPIHGEFEITPDSHILGNGCRLCVAKNRKQKYADDFLKKAKELHGDKYDYSKVNYVDKDTKVTIICPEHGEFQQTPQQHLRAKKQCVKSLRGKYTRKDTSKDRGEIFLQRAKLITGYDYSKVNYINTHTKVTIICPEHGEFLIKPYYFLKLKSCPICCKKITRNNTDTFIQKANLIHHSVYDYSKVIFLNTAKKVTIICPIHGEFFQTPINHLQGQGCPKCRESRGEKKIRRFLTEKNIDFIPEFGFDDCKDKNKLPFDFYVPSKNTLIEFDGEQHFRVVEIFGGEEGFKDRLKKDFIKTQYAKSNGIRLIRIAYDCTDEEINNLLTPLLTSETLKLQLR